MFSNDIIYGSGFAEDAYRNTMKKLKVRGIENLYTGEMHAPLLMSDGSLEVGNYIGPGTQAVKRIYRGDRGKTGVDDLAMRHDALYSLAKTKSDIRKADEDFLKILKKGVVKDNKKNLKTGELGIASKYILEGKTGVLFPSEKELNKNDPNDEKLKEVVRMTDKMYGVQSGKGKLLGHYTKKATLLSQLILNQYPNSKASKIVYDKLGDKNYVLSLKTTGMGDRRMFVKGEQWLMDYVRELEKSLKEENINYSLNGGMGFSVI